MAFLQGSRQPTRRYNKDLMGAEVLATYGKDRADVGVEIEALAEGDDR